MKLKDYLDETDMNISQFAKWIGVSQSMVSKWLSGKSVPGRISMQTIIDKTGRVFPNDFWDMPPTMPVQRKRSAANALEQADSAVMLYNGVQRALAARAGRK